MRRTDSTTRSHYRTNRMLEVGGAWYFKTREMGLVGPFQDELEAFTQLEAFIRLASAGLLPDGDFPYEPAAAESVG